MLIIFEKIVSMFLFSELVALRVEGVNFQGNQIDVRVHSFDLPIFLKSHVELLFHLPRYALLILTSISIFY